jgi:hypothetical protein
MTTEQIQAALEQVEQIRTDLEVAVQAGPEGSLRREALAMATAWLLYARGSLSTALEHEAGPTPGKV